MSQHPSTWERTLLSVVAPTPRAVDVSALPTLLTRDTHDPIPDSLVRALFRTLNTIGPRTRRGERATRNHTIFGPRRAKLLAAVDSMRDALDPQSAHDLSRALLNLWCEQQFDVDLRWCAWAVGMLGSDRITLELCALVEDFAQTGDAQGRWNAENLLEALRAMSNPMAMMAFVYFARQHLFPNLKRHAIETLNTLARDHDCSTQDYEDLLVPECGLEADGSRRLERDDRVFHVGIGEGFEPQLMDAQGVAIDPKEDWAAWHEVRATLQYVFRAQTLRLESAMIDGHRWTRERWERHLHSHPVMRWFVRGLLWGVYDQDDVRTHAFRVDADMSLAIADDTTWELPKGARIGLVHPVTLTQEERMLWGERFADYEIISPFEQLSRMTFQTPVREPDAREVTLPAATTFSAHDVRAHLRASGLRPGQLSSHYDVASGTYVQVYQELHCPLPSLGQGYVLALDTPLSTNPSDLDEAPIRVTCVSFFASSEYEEEGYVYARKLGLGEVDAIVLSEGLRAAHRLHVTNAQPKR